MGGIEWYVVLMLHLFVADREGHQVWSVRERDRGSRSSFDSGFTVVPSAALLRYLCEMYKNNGMKCL